MEAAIHPLPHICTHVIRSDSLPWLSVLIAQLTSGKSVWEVTYLKSERFPSTWYQLPATRYTMMLQMPNLCLFIMHKLIACLLGVGVYPVTAYIETKYLLCLLKIAYSKSVSASFGQHLGSRKYFIQFKNVKLTASRSFSTEKNSEKINLRFLN